MWDSKRKTATIVKEYNPGCHRILCGPAAGIVEADPNKHDSNPKTAAIFELEEECHLSGGTWHRLVRDYVAIPMDKYVITEIVPYLLLILSGWTIPDLLMLKKTSRFWRDYRSMLFSS